MSEDRCFRWIEAIHGIALRTRLTPEAYITFERKAPFKNEFIKGEIVARSGARHAHNRITGDVFNGISNQLADSECDAFVGDSWPQIVLLFVYFGAFGLIFAGQVMYRGDTRPNNSSQNQNIDQTE